MLYDIFSLVCGQVRCFRIEASPLPVCQRCLGLYAGALLTLLGLAASGTLWRGLPGRRMLALQMVALVIAGLGGFHAIDPGPGWRMACGLWEGHVTTAWLACGAALLWSRSRPLPLPCWRKGDSALSAGMLILFTVPALADGWVSAPGWVFWTTVACIGALALYTAGAAALLGAAVAAMRRGSRLMPSPQ